MTKKNTHAWGYHSSSVGTSVGTVSINNGWFAIDLPILKGKLKFSFVGYKDQEIEFTEKNRHASHLYERRCFKFTMR